MNNMFSPAWKILVTSSIAIMLCLLGCNHPAATIEAPEPTDTSTNQPSATATITPTPTITPTSTLSPTATNTLTPQEVDQWILNLLATNGGCELPCLWGITPGETRLDHALALYSPVSERFNFYEDNLYLGFGNPEGDIPQDGGFGMGTIANSDTNLNPAFFEAQEPAVIDYVFGHISIQHSYYPAFPPNRDIQQAAQRFSLENILSDYGIPSRILVRPLIGDEYSWPTIFANILLFYNEEGFAIFYQGPLIYPQPGADIVHCFSYLGVERIEIISHSPSDGMSIFEVVEEYVLYDDLQEDINDHLLLDVRTAFGIGIDEFYDIYSQPTSECLVSDYYIWRGH